MTWSSVKSMPRLASFQDAFAAALVNGGTVDASLASLVAQPGFAVYRNTVMKGCVDALQANYPAVTRVVGEEWLRAAAAVFVGEHLPSRPSLVDYGVHFPDFLAGFAPAAELPYLADVARLDRFWTEAHVAADAQRLSATAIAALDAQRLARSVLRPHPSARWQWFDAQPIFSIWLGNRDGAAPDALASIEWRGEGALLVRPDDTVDSLPLSAAECAFMDACGRDEPLADVAAATLAVDAHVDLSAVLARLLRAGAFAHIEIFDNNAQEMP